MAKTLFITGASTGIGAETARAAARAGWNVALFARSQDKLETLAQEIGDQALAIAGDVTSFEEVSRAVSQTVERFGALDAIFANAGKGIDHPGTEKGEPAEWREMIDLNIMGVLYSAKAALPELKKTRGHFLFTGSRAGRQHIDGSIYGATKWFVHGYVGNLAAEVREWGGRCTLISPGMVDTPFFDEGKPGKLSAPDVADAVVFALGQRDTSCIREVHLMPTD